MGGEGGAGGEGDAVVIYSQLRRKGSQVDCDGRLYMV